MKISAMLNNIKSSSRIKQAVSFLVLLGFVGSFSVLVSFMAGILIS